MDPSHTSTPPRRSIGAHNSPASLGRGVGSSPAYLSTIRKQSLYGTDDRVIIDPGSRIWKIGFSGEPRPRKVFYVRDSFPDDPLGGKDGGIWDVDLVRMADDLDEFRVLNGWSGGVGDVATGELTDESPGDAGVETEATVVDKVEGETRERRDEVLNVIKARLVRAFRDVYYKHLLTESRSRRVIVVENPFLPDPIKHLIASVLLDNLQVRSVSFTPAPVLALMAVGRTTGLVLDVGFQESTVVPVFQGRVLTDCITSTRIAGKAFLSRLILLVERYGRIGDTSPDRQRVGMKLAERIRSMGCFVLPQPSQPIRTSTAPIDLAELLRSVYEPTADPSTRSTLFEDAGSRWNVPSWVRERTGEVYFELGEGGDDEVQGCSLQEVVAECLVQLPIDLRRPMATSILITGGGSVLPGFTTRLKTSLIDLIRRSRPSPPGEGSKRLAKERTVGERPYACLSGLGDEVAILNDTSVTSGSDVDSPPRAVDEGESGGTAAGSAPAWNPGLLSWIGGSLAGALQIGGREYEAEDEER